MLILEARERCLAEFCGPICNKMVKKWHVIEFFFLENGKSLELALINSKCKSLRPAGNSTLAPGTMAGAQRESAPHRSPAKQEAAKTQLAGSH